MKPQYLAPIEKTDITDAVSRRLEDFIVQNGMSDGDKLPSERDLCEMLGVGARTVRKVLQQFETRGIVETIQGKGSFVVNRGVEAYAKHVVESFRFLHANDMKLLVELIYVRRIIEESAIEETIKRNDKKVISELESILVELEDAHDRQLFDQYNTADLQFHRTIVHSTGNILLSALYDHLRELLQETFERTGRLSGAIERSFSEHRRILDFIRRRDVMRAKKELLEHLEHTAKSIRELVAEED